MALYKIQHFVSGKWVDKKEIMAKGVKKAKILSETAPETSQWKDGEGNTQMQDVCKIKFEGMGEEGYKFSLNKPTINVLIHAFGEDSSQWIGKVLAVEAEKTRVAGKAGVAVYLIPEGYEKVDNEEGYAEIKKIGLEKVLKKMKDEEIPVIEEGKEEIDVKNIEF